MNYLYIFTSVTRISDLAEEEFDVEKKAKNHWETGDYVVCRIAKAGSDLLKIELPNGRMRGIMGDELIVGALGERHATLEATGTWKEVKEDNQLNVLTSGGLLGKLTSKSVFIPELIEIEYKGHVTRNGEKVIMDDFVMPMPHLPFKTPVVLFVGTSMSAGKTTSARIVANLFKQAGHKVVGAKLTGAGRLKDILAVKDVGADAVFDFVDAGLPSSICPRKTYAKKLLYLMDCISSVRADVAIIEIGASPLEPYNGDMAIEAMREHVKCTILSASDPYAVFGLMKAFDIIPDIVSGISTNTRGGRDLVENLCGVRALNLIDPKTLPTLRSILNEHLEIKV